MMLLRGFTRLMRGPRQNDQPATQRHVPATQARHWQDKRRYAETHRRLARELGIEWHPSKRK